MAGTTRPCTTTLRRPPVAAGAVRAARLPLVGVVVPGLGMATAPRG